MSWEWPFSLWGVLNACVLIFSLWGSICLWPGKGYRCSCRMATVWGMLQRVLREEITSDLRGYTLTSDLCYFSVAKGNQEAHWLKCSWAMFSHGLNPCLLGSTFTNIRIYLSLPYGRPWLSEAQVITIKPPWLPPMTMLKPPPEDLNHTCCVHADLKHKTSLKRTLGYTGWGGWLWGSPALSSISGELQNISMVTSASM